MLKKELYEENTALRILVKDLKAQNERLKSELESLRANAGVASASTSAETSKKRKLGQHESKINENDAVAVKQTVQQQQRKDVLPDELWAKILEDVDDNSVIIFASVSKQLRRVQQRSNRTVRKYKGLCSYSILSYFRWPLRYKGISAVSEDWCLWALQFQTEENVQKFRDCRENRMRRIMNAAAMWGHLDALKLWKDKFFARKSKYHSCSPPVDNETSVFAALGGQLEVLKWLEANGCPLHSKWSNVCSFAALGGHLEVLKYLRGNRGHRWYVQTSAFAAYGGHLEVLKYLHEKGCPWNEDICYRAASGGHLEVLKYAHEQGCPWDEGTCSAAARRGDLEMLKYARENGCRWSERWICNDAASGGNLEVLKYAHERGCSWNEETCCYAAEGGLDVLKYAHENGCPLVRTPLTCREAARHGHLELLKYLHEHGCLWDEWTCEEAAREGHLEVLKYLHEKGCPWNKGTCREAAGCGHLAVLKYAHENGCPWDSGTCNWVVLGGRLEILKYLHEEGCPWDETTCRIAAKAGNLAVLKYLHENDCPWNEEPLPGAVEADPSGMHLVSYVRGL